MRRLSRPLDSASTARLVLVAGTAVFYAPILLNGWVNFDDPANILHNPWLTAPWPALLAWALHTPLGGHFQPLAWASLRLDHGLWGLNPAGFHFTSLLLFMASALIIFELLRALLDGEVWPAAAAAALFAWHPLRVESVAWATERRDQLSLLFMAWSALLYVRAVKRNPGDPRLSAALAAFVAAALSKVFSAVLPALLIALDLGPLDRPPRLKRLISEKIGFWLVAAATLAFTVRAQIVSEAAPGFDVAGWSDRLTVLAWTPGWAALKTVAPFDLHAFVHVDPAIEPLRFWAVALLTATLAAIFFATRERRGVLVFGLASTVALAPALGLFKSGGQTSADRYTLIPAVVLAVAVALLLRPRNRGWSFAALALACGLGFLTRAQCAVWRDSITLWSRATDRPHASTLALWNHMAALSEAGKSSTAAVVYARIRREDPNSPPGLAAAADEKAAHGDWAAAAEYLRRAVAQAPENAVFRLKYGVALFQTGAVTDAATQFQAAVDDQPDFADAWHLLGVAQARGGRLSTARRSLSRALALNPVDGEVRRDLARLPAARP